MRTYSRILTFESDVENTQKALDVIFKYMYPAVGIRVRKLIFEPLEKYYKHPYLNEGEIDNGERLEKLRASKANKLNLMGRPVLEVPLHYNHIHVTSDGHIEKTSLSKEVDEKSLYKF